MGIDVLVQKSLVAVLKHLKSNTPMNSKLTDTEKNTLANLCLDRAIELHAKGYIAEAREFDNLAIKLALGDNKQVVIDPLRVERKGE